MSAYKTLVPVDIISAADLVTAAKKIWPVATIDGQLCFVDPRDIVHHSYNWQAEAVAIADNLEAVHEITTYHSFNAPSFFKPTAAEVLVQIALPIDQLKDRGITVVAYELAFDGSIDNAFAKIGKETVHRTRAILYSGELPEELKSRTIMCRNHQFENLHG